MKYTIVTILILFLTLSTYGQEKPFWNEIKAFKTQDSISKPKEGMILFIGSSSFRYWTDAAQDFGNDAIVNRAFGGATLLDMITYKNEILLGYHPSKIVIYCGENDVASAPTVDGTEVLRRFTLLYGIIRKQFPKVPLLYVSIKPCPLRWSMRDRMIESNTKISAFLSRDSHNVFVSVWDSMIDHGTPKADIFKEDNLHMNKKGYALWVAQMKSFVNR